MKRFHFKLEPVLQLRRRDEDDRLRDVAVIERERAALESRLREQQGHIIGAKTEWSEQLRGTLDLHALRSRAHRSLHAVREAQQLAIALAGVHHRLDAARRRLAEAVRRRRAIELLRDRALETWRRDEDRRETAELDDLGKASVAFSLEYRADEDQP